MHEISPYEAYLDHSFTGGGETHACTLAAIVAPEGTWVRFAAAWDAAMKRGGAEGKFLHMKELVHGVGEWPGWQDVTKQTRLFTRLVPVVRKYVGWGLCVSFPLAPWHNTPLIRDRDEHPDFPILLLLQAVMEWIIELVRPTPQRPVHSFMEEDHLVEADATRQFYYITRARGWQQLLPLIRALPKGLAPLQAADMIAYEGSRFMSEQQLGKSTRPPRKLFEVLEQCPQLMFRHMTPEAFVRFTHAALAATQKFREDPKLNAELEKRVAAAARQTQRERSALGRERKNLRQRGSKT